MTTGTGACSSHVVAYEAHYPRVDSLARQYGVNRLSVRPEVLLAS